jgi:hypothetical protein
MEPLAEFVLLKSVLEGLVKLPLVELVYFEEKVLDFLIIRLLQRLFLENGQKLKLGNRIKRIDGILPTKIIDGIDLSKILGPFFKQLLIKKVQTRIGMQLDVEIIA